MNTLKLEDVQKLLGSDFLEGDKEQLTELVSLTSALVDERGENWVKVHRHLLLMQWEEMLKLGLV